MPVVHGESGEILSVGRRRRPVPAPIRCALRLRGRGRRVPGCTPHRHVDAHHVQHWADGGETKLSNLVELCRHYHRLCTRAAGLRATDDGVFVFSRPDGRRIADVPVMLPLDCSRPGHRLASWAVPGRQRSPLTGPGFRTRAAGRLCCAPLNGPRAGLDLE